MTADIIMASEKARGKTRIRSVEAARRKVEDYQIYLIRRHGQWFRPGAHGYTSEVNDAGLFLAHEARGYLDVEGVSVVVAGPVVDEAHAKAALVKVKLEGMLKRIEQENARRERMQQRARYA